MAGGETSDAPDAKKADREAMMSAMKRILGDDLPERRLNAALKRCGHTVSFAQFCEITADIQTFMAAGRESGMDMAEAEEVERRTESKLKMQQEPDVFEILGIAKSKDIAEMQSRKDQALKNVAAETFKASGMAVLASRKFVRGVGARRDARSITLEGGAEGKDSAAQGSGRRFEVVPGPGAKRTLTVKAAVGLPRDLPQMQVRSTGAACFVLRFSPDGSQIAGGFYDGGLRIYDVDTASMEHCLNLPKFMGGTYTQLAAMAGPPDLAQVALERKDSPREGEGSQVRGAAEREQGVALCLRLHRERQQAGRRRRRAGAEGLRRADAHRVGRLAWKGARFALPLRDHRQPGRSRRQQDHLAHRQGHGHLPAPEAGARAVLGWPGQEDPHVGHEGQRRTRGHHLGPRAQRGRPGRVQGRAQAAGREPPDQDSLGGVRPEQERLRVPPEGGGLLAPLGHDGQAAAIAEGRDGEDPPLLVARERGAFAGPGPRIRGLSRLLGGLGRRLQDDSRRGRERQPGAGVH
ncbi:unnamed protein product [Prorocentrum cordatum]|nr:unnamed protein product [Polarella glacialis]